MRVRLPLAGYNPPYRYPGTNRLKFHAVGAAGGPGCVVDGGPGVVHCAKCEEATEVDTVELLITLLDKYAGSLP